MNPTRAEENLQTIRTLMERSALYRRALAPVMTCSGVAGIAGALLGWALKIGSAAGFAGYWLAVAVLAIGAAFLLVRRQAVKSSEPFWSPPARRVALALSAPLAAGFVLGVLCIAALAQAPAAEPPAGMGDGAGDLFWLPALWALFYGCALHSAGFFTSSSLRRFGWIFIAAGLAVLVWAFMGRRQDCAIATWQGSHCLMGTLFGVLQLAYGAYLFITEKYEL